VYTNVPSAGHTLIGHVQTSSRASLTEPVHREGPAGEATAVRRGQGRRDRGRRAGWSVGRRLMPDKSETALTAEYPRVAGRRIISRPDGRTDRTDRSPSALPAAEVPAVAAAGRPPAAGRVLSMSARDKWRRQQQTTMLGRKQDGQRAPAEVEERDGKDISEPTDVTADVTAALAVNLLTTRPLRRLRSSYTQL